MDPCTHRDESGMSHERRRHPLSPLFTHVIGMVQVACHVVVALAVPDEVYLLGLPQWKHDQRESDHLFFISVAFHVILRGMAVHDCRTDLLPCMCMPACMHAC